MIIMIIKKFLVWQGLIKHKSKYLREYNPESFFWRMAVTVGINFNKFNNIKKK